jgi:hypothetical protein
MFFGTGFEPHDFFFLNGGSILKGEKTTYGYRRDEGA